MWLRRETPRAAARRHARSLQFESMETRTMLSTVAPVVQVRHQLVKNLISSRRALNTEATNQRQAVMLGMASTPPKSSPLVQARHQVVENLVSSRRALRIGVSTQHRQRVAARRAAVAAGYVPPPPPTPRTIWSRGSFAYNTVQNGITMTKSSPVIRAGVDYAKRIIAPDTRKVAAAYLGAIVGGNGKQINALGHTDAVKTVKQEFVNLGNSSNFKKVGNAFEKFGNGVAKEFRRVFGPKSSAPPVPKKPVKA
jgi:hypothetical protein